MYPMKTSPPGTSLLHLHECEQSLLNKELAIVYL